MGSANMGGRAINEGFQDKVKCMVGQEMQRLSNYEEKVSQENSEIHKIYLFLQNLQIQYILKSC